MKILWQNEHYPDVVRGGGGAINTYYIVRSLQRLGHNVAILAKGSDGPVRREEVKGTTVIRIAPILPGLLWPAWPLLEPAYLRRRLEEVVHSFDAFVCVDASYSLSIKRLYPGRPLIFRVEGLRKGHDAAVQELTPALSLSERKRRAVRRLLVLENDLMDRLAWRRCDAIVVKSEMMRRDLGTLYRVRADKIHVVPNGVDYWRYADAQISRETLDRIGNPDGAKVVIAFCGRLVAMKNVPYLLRGFARMRLRDRCMLAVLGDGDQRHALEDEARRLGIDSQVRFVGHTERVEEFLAASDIFVLPSTYEPFGNALLEAMAAGLPCVALRPNFETVRVASSEIIEDERTGYLLRGDKPDDLARRLDALAGDPELRRRLGVAGQALCRERYDWDTCARSYARLAGDGALEGEPAIGRP